MAETSGDAPALCPVRGTGAVHSIRSNHRLLVTHSACQQYQSSTQAPFISIPKTTQTQPVQHSLMKHFVHNTGRAVTLAAAILSSMLPACAGLIAQFRIDEGSIDNTTNLTYSADNLYTGTLSGGTPPTWITSGLSPLLTAQSGTVAAITNGTAGGYIATDFWGTNGSGASVLGTNARTITAWVRTPVNPTASYAAYIVSYGSGSTIVGGRFSLRLDTTAGTTLGKIRLEVSSGSIVGTNSVI